MNKQTQKTLFSSRSDEWETPPVLVNNLEKIFGKFNLDPCATESNRKCDNYYTINEDGLNQQWYGNVFINPPYSAIDKWVKKSYNEAMNNALKTVMLIPSRTDTRYFHDYITKSSKIYFLKGRVKFGDGIGLVGTCAPFPSIIVCFDSFDLKYIKVPKIDFLHTKDLMKEKQG